MTALRCLLFVAAACSPSSSPPVTTSAPAFVAVTAVHGQPIDGMAVTHDGDAAVTADRLGLLRLWPTLDGSREPVVITGVAARELAIVRDGEEFVIAALDQARHVAISRWSARGEPRARIQLESPALQIAAVGASFLLLTEDHAVEHYGMRGELRARLVPDPGTRVESLAVRGDRALAMIASRDRVHGRWIETHPAADPAAWGTATASLTIAADLVVLSPDGHTIAGVDRTTRVPQIVDATTGLVTRSAICNASRISETQQRFGIESTIPLGFHDARTIVCAAHASMVWWSLDAKPPKPALAGVAFSSTAASAFTDGRVFVAHDTQLAVVASTVQYLGYETKEFPHVRFTPHGMLVGRGDQHATLLDRDFQQHAAIALPAVDWTWFDMVPLDQRYLLTLSANAIDNKIVKQIAVFDTQTRQLGPLLVFEGADETLTYEPSTGLVITTEAGKRAVRTLDPVTRTFGPPTIIDTPLAYLVDPALAGGVAVLAVSPGDGSFQVVERLAPVVVGAPFRDGRTYRVPGEFRAVDRAGHLYMTARHADGGDIVVFDRGEPTMTIADIASHMIRPSASGAWIATFGDQRITLYGADGVARWTVPAMGARDLGWTGDALIGQFSAAFVRFDISTGSFAARQCGWGFGLSATARIGQSTDGVVCDVAP